MRSLARLFRPVMTPREKRETVASLVFVGAMALLCAALAILQYRWAGEISSAEQLRLRASLDTSLERVARELKAELTEACRRLLPAEAQSSVGQLEGEISRRFIHYRGDLSALRLFRAIATAVPSAGGVSLRVLNLESGRFSPAAWPPQWSQRQKMYSELAGPWQGPPPIARPQDLVFEIPVFETIRPRQTRNPPLPMAAPAWLMIEVDPAAVLGKLLPELLHRHLSDGNELAYQVAVFTRWDDSVSVFESASGTAKAVREAADASGGLLDIEIQRLIPPPWRLPASGPGEPPSATGEQPGNMFGGPPQQSRALGRWRMYVRHRAGSLDAVVTHARWRNLAVAGGVLALLVASLGALVRFTSRAQRLAQLQIEFVAGVSHELRTPLTVLNTAGYNLKGRLAHHPVQVERYGEVIQQESGRLRDLVERILAFARMQAGYTIGSREPLALAQVVKSVVNAQRGAIAAAGCRVELSIDPCLPSVLGDDLALRQAFENLLTNAVKHGAEGSDRIGVTAARVENRDGEWVELRVRDHGPGIPDGELNRIFDPFYRGQRAREGQIGGSGLGLNLALKIVRAHGGQIAVQSKPMQGAEFTIRLPAAVESQSEFANSVD